MCVSNWIKHLLVGAFCACALFVAPSIVSATYIYHADEQTPEVLYTNIREDSFTNPLPNPGHTNGYFGDAAVTPVGNTLYFPDLIAGKYTFGSPDSGYFDVALKLTIVDKTNRGLDGVTIHESGDYDLTDLFGGSLAAVSIKLVNSEITLRTSTLQYVTVSLNNVMGFTPNNGTAILFAGPAGSTVTGAWSGDMTLDLAAIAADYGLTGYVTEADLTLDNRLTAQATGTAMALVMKKDLSLTTTVNPVPEPSTFALFGTGALVACGWWWRKRKSG